MEGNDLALWSRERYAVVLEGPLVPELKLKRTGRVKVKETLPPGDDWSWSTMGIKMIRDAATRWNVPVDVVTFINQDAADEAAEFFQRYGVDVSDTTYAPFRHFCESLKWRKDVGAVIDTDRHRIQHYGQLGRLVMPGREW